MGTKYTFGLKLVSSKIMSLYIAGLTIYDSWAEKIGISLGIASVMSFLMEIPTTIEGVLDISVDLHTLEDYKTTTIPIALGMAVSIWSELRGLTATFSNTLGIRNDYPFRALYRLSINIAGSLTIAVTATLATFVDLDVYDPQTLGTLDVLTLATMDSTII